MTLYHGSPLKGLTELVPFYSEHGKPYVYLARNSIVALFYAAKPVDKPYSWYPYGFDVDVPVYTEYYENALFDVYGGRKGYLYECETDCAANSTEINCAVTVGDSVKTASETEITDLYEHFLLLEKRHKLKIKRYADLTNGERGFIEKYLRELIEKDALKTAPENTMSAFIRRNFPTLL